MSTDTTSSTTQRDVVLIGAGVMSATLATYLRQLEPDWSVDVFERLESPALESSGPWNNAGTGHSALCELNYTPEKPDGSIDISKAVNVNEQFQISRQFWAHLTEAGIISDPRAFLSPIPHMSFVWGEKNVSFLDRRYQALKDHPLFSGMEYSEDPAKLAEWMPLVMKDRAPGQRLAATRTEAGTDVNFGALTRILFDALGRTAGFSLITRHDVTNLKKSSDGRWLVQVKSLVTGEHRTVSARFVFIGAGGAALELLQKSGIPEGRGIGGFPVSGQFLRCTNPEVVRQHSAKVYGKAAVGAPPMSVPHLDTRMVDGKASLLFGPYAGFSTRFLKKGSLLDLPLSIKPGNIRAMMAVGRDNWDLTKYLIQQVMQSPADRMAALREFVPDARESDWELIVAGQRVQVIKSDKAKGGVLQFGTEVVTAADGSVAALLGASPGASTAAPIMLTILQRCFRSEIAKWEPKLREMIPSYGTRLADNPEMCAGQRHRTTEILRLTH
ncbi:malate:quinone oxidoreductase [Acetobacter sp. AN02]|uniref:malate:quinone oxidoreductase n=1 Tax=Acetobacter sp. AN02 TaxID=2894186 RepID=UPI0024344D78|nr:malate:quinone oxidoreductase [Acetobacter sp. AN02]MDG6095444.1 malate:quinone oxidoreductase [Acetobacter sp. AN02]